jgi:hypothetical protein
MKKKTIYLPILLLTVIFFMTVQTVFSNSRIQLEIPSVVEVNSGGSTYWKDGRLTSAGMSAYRYHWFNGLNTSNMSDQEINQYIIEMKRTITPVQMWVYNSYVDAKGIAHFEDELGFFWVIPFEGIARNPDNYNECRNYFIKIENDCTNLCYLPTDCPVEEKPDPLQKPVVADGDNIYIDNSDNSVTIIEECCPDVYQEPVYFLEDPYIGVPRIQYRFYQEPWYYDSWGYDPYWSYTQPRIQYRFYQEPWYHGDDYYSEYNYFEENYYYGDDHYYFGDKSRKKWRWTPKEKKHDRSDEGDAGFCADCPPNDRPGGNSGVKTTNRPGNDRPGGNGGVKTTDRSGNNRTGGNGGVKTTDRSGNNRTGGNGGVKTTDRSGNNRTGSNSGVDRKSPLSNRTSGTSSSKSYRSSTNSRSMNNSPNSTYSKRSSTSGTKSSNNRKKVSYSQQGSQRKQPFSHRSSSRQSSGRRR